MLEDAFRSYLEQQNLADKTRKMRIYALKRIERYHGLDLDAEFERDGLQSLAGSLSYSSADAREARANPSKLNIDPDKLRTHLAWYRSHLQSYRSFKSGSPGLPLDGEVEQSAAIDDTLLESVTQTFGLERDMQAALRGNLAQLEPGLVAIDDGNERRVDAGFIDILARDKAGVVTVIELKSETSRPAAVAQILSYMGCVAAETEGLVRGILVASDHDARVVFAAKAVPNLQLKRYRFRFEFD